MNIDDLPCVKVDKRRAAMDKFRAYREKHVVEYADTIEARLALRFVKYKFSFFTMFLIYLNRNNTS